MADLRPGLSARITWTVTEEMTAAAVASGAVRAFSTPHLVALMECAAVSAADPCLEEGWISVGTMVHVEHLAATPVGAAVTAYARLTAVDGRKLRFEVEAYCGPELIGRGVHERIAVRRDRFMAKMRDKTSGLNP